MTKVKVYLGSEPIASDDSELVLEPLTNDIHISDVRAFKRCRQYWDWASPLRRSLRAKRPAAPLWTGAAIHAALDRYYSTKPEQRLKPADYLLEWIPGEVTRLKELLGADSYNDIKPQMRENVGLAEQMLNTYFYWSQKHDDFDVFATEQEFRLPVGAGLDLCGKFDQVVVRDDGLWVHEFKTTASWWQEEYLFLDEQLNAYLAAARSMFEGVKGVIFTFLLKKAPTKPKMLKSGRLSFARINTTYEMALSTIREYKQSPKLYQDVLLELSEQESPFVRRVPILRERDELAHWWEEMSRVAELMVDPDVVIYHNPDMIRCRSCDFYEPCILKQQGDDPSDLLRVNYTRAKRLEDTVANANTWE